MKLEGGPFLLDVNVLVALFDSRHPHHEAAQNWFAGIGPRGWRTCPITENGLIRVLSNPVVSGYSARWIAEELENSKARASGHGFWADSFSVSAWLRTVTLEIPSSKVTDAYLLGLAARNGGSLATFDLGITPGLIGAAEAGIVEWI